MTTTFQLHEAELDNQFVVALKTLFKGQQLTVTVEAEEISDETTYLLSSTANRERLLTSVRNVEIGEHLIETDVARLKQDLLPDA